MEKIITYTVAALAVIGVGVVLFSLIGVAVFLLPLLAGAFKNRIISVKQEDMASPPCS